jgi:hypothetical protein
VARKERDAAALAGVEPQARRVVLAVDLEAGLLAALDRARVGEGAGFDVPRLDGEPRSEELEVELHVRGALGRAAAPRSSSAGRQIGTRASRHPG